MRQLQPKRKQEQTRSKPAPGQLLEQHSTATRRQAALLTSVYSHCQRGNLGPPHLPGPRDNAHKCTSTAASSKIKWQQAASGRRRARSRNWPWSCARTTRGPTGPQRESLCPPASCACSWHSSGKPSRPGTPSTSGRRMCSGGSCRTERLPAPCDGRAPSLCVRLQRVGSGHRMMRVLGRHAVPHDTGAGRLHRAAALPPPSRVVSQYESQPDCDRDIHACG